MPEEKPVKKFPKIYFVYFGVALMIGLILSFGLAGFMHQPLPLQVPVQEYAPASPPAPAVPTIAPANPDTGKFAPAPAPVIVTTQPLPTITPVPATPEDSTKSPFCNSQQSLISNIMSAFTIGGIGMIIAGLSGVMFALISIMNVPRSSNTILTTSILSIVTGGIFLITGNVIIGSFIGAISSGVC